MAIGVEGGFSADVKKDEFDEINQIVIIPSYQTFSIGKFFTVWKFQDFSVTQILREINFS